MAILFQKLHIPTGKFPIVYNLEPIFFSAVLVTIASPLMLYNMALGPNVYSVGWDGAYWDAFLTCVLLPIFYVLIARGYRFFRSPKAGQGARELLEGIAPGTSEVVELRISKKDVPLERSTLLQHMILVPRDLEKDPSAKCRLAHELGHVRNRDYTIFWIYSALIIGMLIMQPYLLATQRLDPVEYASPEEAEFYNINLFVFPLLIIMLAFFRRRSFLKLREFRADAVAYALLGNIYKEYLQRNLKKEEKLNGHKRSNKSFSRSHPTFHERLKRLGTTKMSILSWLIEVPLFVLFTLLFVGGIGWSIFATMLMLIAAINDPRLFLPSITNAVWLVFPTVIFLNAFRP